MCAANASIGFAQQPEPSSNGLALLARAACETGTRVNGDVDIGSGYLTMLGVSQNSYSLRVLQSGPHAITISEDQCSDPQRFILGHAFQNKWQQREIYYYLTNQRGELLNAVHFQEGRSHLFAYADIVRPVRRADFESEKTVWLSRISNPPTLQRASTAAD